MNAATTEIVTTLYLIRHGVIPQVILASVTDEADLSRGTQVVVQTARGPELGQVLERYRPALSPATTDAIGSPILRIATNEDNQTFTQLQRQARTEFSAWEERIREWNLDLQLIDLEWLLDQSRLVLYVLNERGPECTKLALQAAAAGFGVIDVQPVSLEGLVTAPVAEKKGGGGCGNCGSH